ncbi:MAG: protein translocase subunit SecD [Phycisphaerales bacterium]|nr:protein translocase subunit SecD [Phycisphaerales bacterium]
MQNLLWKLILIIVLIGGCLWAAMPPGEKIRLGRDLSGGVSLIYSVRMPDNADRSQILEQTIRVLNDRVNPQGVLDISMTPLGADRIEIVMPLPNEEVKKLAAAYEQSLETFIAEAEINQVELQAALEQRDAVARFGGNASSDRGRLIVDLQDAWNAQVEVQVRLQTAESTGGEVAQIRALQLELADAQIEFEELLDETLALSLDRARVVRALELSNIGDVILDAEGNAVLDETGTPQRKPSARETTLQLIVDEYPHLADVLDQTTASFDAYQVKRTGLDDPADLMRLLQGAGVIEFRIAVEEGKAEGVNVDDLRAQLVEVGPENTDSMQARWFAIHDLKQWASTPEQLAVLEAGPQAFLAGRGLVAAEADGIVYLLLYTSSPKSLTHDGSADWTVESTSRSADGFGRPAVAFRLDQAGGQGMSKLTQPHVGSPMAIVLDGKVYTAPTLQSHISNNGQITGSFSDGDIDYLIRVLASGALEARLSNEPIAVNVLGPSLGADNLDRGFDAFLWAVLVVAVFMLVWYLFAGMVADLALLCNGIIIFGVMAMLHGTFTLPGLAGVVLTMGMAVDANVLIYERIREEIEGGAKDLREAIREGYGRVYATILDANLTNLIVCAVLLLMQPTTEVKGFALTLTIGILATLFTALFVTRFIFDIYAHVCKVRSMPMLATMVPTFGRLLRPNIDWIGLRGIFWTMSFLLISGSIALFFIRGADIFDTEFRGGVAVTMRTAEVGDDSNLMLRHSGPDSVLQRVRGISDGVGEGDDLDARVLRELRNAKILTVGNTGLDADGNTVADAFQVKVANPTGLGVDQGIQRIVETALLEEFGDELAVSEPRRFTGAGSDSYAQYTRPIEMRTLGDVLERDGFATDLSAYRGGVLVLLEDIEPAITVEDVQQRIDQMRQDPDFASDAAGREVVVYGLEEAASSDEAWHAVAVVVSDPDLNYLRSESALVDQRLASREWDLIRAAMTKRSSFEQVSSFAPSVAQTRSANAIGAIILSLAGILCYIWIRFGSFYYSLGAIVALCHDVIIVLGFLALSGFIAGNEFVWKNLLIDEFLIDTGVVAALLTVIGYSLNDTIVILDRIRENRGKRALPTRDVVNTSINQAFSRTVLTSVTTAIAVLIIYITGGTGIRAFAFALLIGVLVGTYSSVAIASPLVYRRGNVLPPTDDEEAEADMLSDEGVLSTDRHPA